MDLSQLEFGALLTYASHGDSPDIQHSKDVMFALKRDGFVGRLPILMSGWIARAIVAKDFSFLYKFDALHTFQVLIACYYLGVVSFRCSQNNGVGHSQVCG